jgi:hypothetical protein
VLEILIRPPPGQKLRVHTEQHPGLRKVKVPQLGIRIRFMDIHGLPGEVKSWNIECRKNGIRSEPQLGFGIFAVLTIVPSTLVPESIEIFESRYHGPDV